MQKVGITTLRRHTDNQTSQQKKESNGKKLGQVQRSYRSIQSQSQMEKNKFAQEYAKLTHQFRKILSKGSNKIEQRMTSNPAIQGQSTKQIKTGFFAEGQKNRTALKSTSLEKDVSKNILNHRKISKIDERQIKLQSLYNNKLHYDILQTASKLQRSKRQKTSPSHISPLSPHHQVPHMAVLTPTSAHNVKNFTNSPVDKEIFVHLQQQKMQKINIKFNQIPETLAHFHNLFKIYELLENYKNNYALLIKNIKKYVMNHNKADISKLDNLLKINKDKERLKVLLCLQKIAVIGILEAMIRQNELYVKNQARTILEIIFGVYSSIFSFILSESQSSNTSPQIPDQQLQSLQLCNDLLYSLQIQKRKDLESTIEFLYKKIQYMFRSNQTLFHKIKQILTSITKISLNNTQIAINYGSNANINRFFYFLLCQYAHWMNCGQNVQILKVHKNLLDFFVTCPSPHLIYAAPEGKLTIVLQLEGTLASVKFSSMENSKLSIKLRPFALQLIKQLHQQAQIVVMTSLLPENLPILSQSTKIQGRKGPRKQEPYQEMLKLCSCLLFKHHYVRYRGLLVKDLSRIGRKLQSLILVDDVHYGTVQLTTNGQVNGQEPKIHKLMIEQNSINEQNTIPIETWRGNPKDDELLYLKQLLSNIILQQPTDVKKVLSKFKQGKTEMQSGRTAKASESQESKKDSKKFSNQEAQQKDNQQIQGL